MDQRAERSPFFRRVEHLLHLRFVGDVRADEAGIRAQLAGHLLAGRARQIRDGDAGAFRQQLPRACQTEAGCAPGNYCYDAFDFHCLLAQSFSMMVAFAMPPASHIVCRP